jgi:ABC-type glycerol-3-phosphate transport system permease component
MLSTSLKSVQETMTAGVNFIPHKFDFSAYKRIFTDYPFADYYKSSIVVSLFTVTISVVFALFAGYGVTRFRFRGKGAFLTFLLMTHMFPSIMLLIPYYVVLRTFNIDNSHTGLILVYISHALPLCIWMMKGYMETIPKSLDESAMIDGYRRPQILFKIIVPLAMPGIASTAIYSFIQAWNEYMYVSVLINTEKLKTLPIGIGQLNGYYRIQYNDLMAACFVSSIPIMILYVIMQKYFINSLLAGAVKE